MRSLFASASLVLLFVSCHAFGQAYTRVYTDAEGETHFAQETLRFVSTDYAPPSPPLDVSTPADASGMAVLRAPPGWFGDFHVAPRRQFVYVLSGAVEIGVSDGSFRQLPTGSIVLVEDTTGKGHSTRSIGTEPLLLVAVPIEGPVNE